MTKIKIICEKVMIDLAKLPRDSKEFQDKYIYLYQIIKDLYPEEFKEFIANIKLDREITSWNSQAQELLNAVESFGLDLENKLIFIKLYSEKITAPLIDVNSFLINKLGLSPGSWEFALATSVLIQPDFYEKFQLVNSLILNDSNN